ncbi:SseB family protein [Cochlodiniinecator piscidefendens]|uniref:SseB family protein n=1 Tax=Cochlodiniinecator piscidefendens TaxID=2715756 RepID=UPI00140ACA40|nr:SseB family protein [Cochlodiniinecator piscidefendens]
MTNLTPIDTAHQTMDTHPDDETARLNFYARLAESELFILLAEEADGDNIAPQVFEVDGQSFVLAFDREARLAEFAGEIVPYASVSGRVLSGMLAGEGIGIALNPEVAPSEILLPAEAIEWLAETLASSPEEVDEAPQSLTAPVGLPETLMVALDGKLALMAGLATQAYVAGVEYESGRKGHLLGIVGATPGAEGAIAQAVSDALVLSGIEAGALDVAFFRASDTICASLAKVGLRFDLPEPTANDGPSAPGMDPNSPPKLR